MMSLTRFNVKFPRIRRIPLLLLMAGVSALAITGGARMVSIEPYQEVVATLEAEIKKLQGEKQTLASQIAANRAASPAPASTHGHADSHSLARPDDKGKPSHSSVNLEPEQHLIEKVMKLEAPYGNKALLTEAMVAIAQLAQDSNISQLSYRRNQQSAQRQEIEEIATITRLGEDKKPVDEYILRAPLDINLQASYFAIAKFIAGIKSLPYPVVISDFNLTKDSNNDNPLQGHVNLVIYLRSNAQKQK